jgi:hypothetical protein
MSKKHIDPETWNQVIEAMEKDKVAEAKFGMPPSPSDIKNDTIQFLQTVGIEHPEDFIQDSAISWKINSKDLHKMHPGLNSKLTTVFSSSDQLHVWPIIAKVLIKPNEADVREVLTSCFSNKFDEAWPAWMINKYESLATTVVKLSEGRLRDDAIEKLKNFFGTDRVSNILHAYGVKEK